MMLRPRMSMHAWSRADQLFVALLIAAALHIALLGVNGLWPSLFPESAPSFSVMSDLAEGEAGDVSGISNRQHSGNEQDQQRLKKGRDAQGRGDEGELLLSNDLTPEQLQIAAQQGRKILLQRKSALQVRYSAVQQAFLGDEAQTVIKANAAAAGDGGQDDASAMQGDSTVLRIGPASKEDIALQYVEGWRRWMSANGNLFYPAEARRLGLRGEVLTQVRLNSDGSLDDVSILRGSGQRLLDEAVLETTRAARWYLPFPPDLAARYQQLEFSWRWRYGAAK